MPPSFFMLVASALDKLAYYVGSGWGKSWNAQNTWNKRKENIPEKIIQELRKIVKTSPGNFGSLSILLKSLENEESIFD